MKYPLKRMGERGEDKWQRISWDEAFDTCEKRLRDIRDKYGAESVIFAQGTGRDAGGPIIFLAYAYGSPNWSLFGLAGIACFTPRLAAMHTIEGDATFPDAAQFFPRRYDDPEWTPPKVLISWARNLQGSQCTDHYFTGHWVVDMMRRGTRLIVIDPVCTWEASRAEIWLPVRPGTDGALALGLLNVIINEGLYDKEFVDKWTYGFDKLAERVQQFPPEKVEDITWVPRDKIIAAARLYAESKPAAIRFGQPLDSNAEATSTIHALTCLWSITGNLDIPGGNVICRPPYGVTIYPYSTQELLQLYSQEFVDNLSKKRIGADRYPLVKNFRAWAEPTMILEQMESGKPYPIKGIWIQTNNFMANTAQDPRRHYEAVRKLDFNVVVDVFMTPTAQAVADIVLPAASFPEKDSVFSTGLPLNAIQKVLTVDECKPDWEIDFELAKRLSPEAIPFKNVKELLTARLKPSGLTYEQLCQQVWALAPKGHPTTPYRRYEKGLLRPDGKPGFRTPTGKIELYSTVFESYGLDPLPHHKEQIESPVSTPDIYKEYPLIMITGRRCGVMFHSEHRQIPWLREIEPHPSVDIHPDTAKSSGINDGDWVWIEGVRGKIKRKARYSPAMHPKMVHALHGWWLPETEGKAPHFYGIWDINVNLLIPAGCQSSSGFGGAPTKTMLCKIYKVKD
ncbi:MAG: molybdopterin-dependent oxidoreductase [Dehalococcoidia bacterium]|nr:molybdopterin-dependent oxidoreductase [Dehalococcoidia bacterium]